MSADGRLQGTPLAARAAAVLRALGPLHSGDGGRWGRWSQVGLALLLLALSSAAALVWVPGPQAWILVAILALVGVLVAWGTQFAALLRLDHPHAAHLVPGHSQALRATALGLWLGWLALCSAVAVVAAGLLDAGWRPVLLAVMGSGAALLYTAMALRWWGLWVAFWLAFPLLNLLSAQPVVRPFVSWLKDRWAEMPLVCTLIALLAMVALLSGLFGRAGDAHARAYASRERLRSIAANEAVGQKPVLAAYGRWGEWLGWPFQRLWDAWLAQITARARPERRSVMARAEFVLHGSQHVVRHLGAIALVYGLLFGGFALVTMLAGSSAQQIFGGSLVGVSIGLASMVVGPLVNLPGALWLSRREQALLMLLPGMPQGAALNQALGWRQMRHALLVWAAALPGVLLLVWLGAGADGLAFFGAALPLSAWLWRDVSRQQAPRAASAIVPYVAMLGLGLLSLLLLRWQPAALLPWALGVLAVSAGLMVWRWRRLAQFPQALPAGRLVSRS